MMALPSSVVQYHTTISNSYDQNYDRLTQTTDSNAGTLSYSYTNGNLDSLTRTNYTGGDSQTYSFTYNNFGDRTSVSVGTRTLASYEYNTTNGNLTKQTYGNGAYTVLLYDPLYRCTKQTTVSNGNTREVLFVNGNAIKAGLNRACSAAFDVTFGLGGKLITDGTQQGLTTQTATIPGNSKGTIRPNAHPRANGGRRAELY